MIYLAIFSIFLIYLIDTFLIGVTYQSLKIRYGWKISPKKSFIILFFAFAILENYLLPLLFALDLRITIGNERIAKLIDAHGSIHSLELFDPGIFEFIVWCSQAFFAGIIGPKLLDEQKWQHNKAA